MRYWLALAFLFCSLQDAAALHNASAQDTRDIADQIIKKKAAEDEIKTQYQALKAARGDERLELPIRTEIARLKKVQKNAAEQAMWLTIRAYGIITFEGTEPKLPKGTSFLRSPEIGQEITWVPVFEDKHTFEIQDAAGNVVGTLKLDDAGNTASDGVSRIFPEAFISPAILASYIIHEKIHFEQFTDPHRGPVKTSGELEVEAYKTEQKLLDEGPLVFSAHERTLQEPYIAKNLQKRTAQALRERAAMAKGNPPLDVSIISHPKVEIDGLIQQAKDQIEIAQRDHDERLKKALGALTSRSCANPGSVSQEELNGLSQPYDDSFSVGKLPNGAENCSSVYLYLAQGGRDAEALRTFSSPPPDFYKPIQPTPIQPIQSQIPSFSSIFPQLKEFAIATCHGKQPAQPIYNLYRKYDIIRWYEDDQARKLTAGMDNCSRQLFNKAIAKTRDDNGYFRLSSEWVKGVLAANPPEPVTAPVPGYTPPQEKPQDPPCFWQDGYRVCPKSVR